ncbi:hypothetical protein D3C87_132330 [compost metagenome]
MYTPSLSPPNDTQNYRYNGDDDQDVNDSAGIKTAKKTDGPNENQNDCDGIK